MTKKHSKRAEIERIELKDKLRREGFRLPHGYEVVIRKKRKRKSKK